MTTPDATTYRPVSMSLIREPSHRLRESIDAEALGQLADSIAAEGLHQPVGVRGPLEDGTFEIIWGHRRMLACELLRWASIPARVFPADYDPLLASVTENLQRSDLTPLEEALAIQRFADRGEPLAAIARLFRRSTVWVSQRLALLGLTADLQEVVQKRELALGVARLLGDIDHADYRRALIEEAKRTGATAGTVEIWRAHYLADRDRILSNYHTVEEIAARRENWKIMLDCEACGATVDYAATRSWRLCSTCSGDIAQAVDEARRAAPAQ